MFLICSNPLAFTIFGRCGCSLLATEATNGYLSITAILFCPGGKSMQKTLADLEQPIAQNSYNDFRDIFSLNSVNLVKLVTRCEKWI